MTASGRGGPTGLRRFLPGLLLLAGGSFLILAAPATAGGFGGDVGLTGRIVYDPFSGLALFGYDPVAYFTERKPVLGQARFETVWRGAAWRFASAGNQAAFEAHPEVYAPRFGGHDPKGVVLGAAIPGTPTTFAVLGARLYLFRDEASLAEILSAPDLLPRAETSWPALAKHLAE